MVEGAGRRTMSDEILPIAMSGEDLPDRTPRYPEIVVDLEGEPFEVFNRVVLALRDANVHPGFRDMFVVEATQGFTLDELQRVARRWVTPAGKEEDAS
jgi:hypothetical protein